MAGHFLCWIVVASTWAVNWWREGPAPSGPLYNFAKDFICHLDLFVHHTVREWSLRIALTSSTWFSANIDAVYTASFGILILLTGTLQWFLLGQFVQWIASRGRPRMARTLLVVYGVWSIASFLLWVAA